MDEGAVLEKRCPLTGTVGSNPTLSAAERCWSGRTGTPGKRVGPLRALAGSNPALSAARPLLRVGETPQEICHLDRRVRGICPSV